MSQARLDSGQLGASLRIKAASVLGNRKAFTEGQFFTVPWICGGSTVLFSWQQTPVMKAEEGVSPSSGLQVRGEKVRHCTKVPHTTVHTLHVFTIRVFLKVPPTSFSYLDGLPGRQVV